MLYFLILSLTLFSHFFVVSCACYFSALEGLHSITSRNCISFISMCFNAFKCLAFNISFLNYSILSRLFIQFFCVGIAVNVCLTKRSQIDILSSVLFGIIRDLPPHDCAEKHAAYCVSRGTLNGRVSWNT